MFSDGGGSPAKKGAFIMIELRHGIDRIKRITANATMVRSIGLADRGLIPHPLSSNIDRARAAAASRPSATASASGDARMARRPAAVVPP